MFHKLGVDTTVTPRTYVDDNGVTQTLRDSYNPLGVGLKTLNPLSEIYIAGRGTDATHPNQVLFDDWFNSGKKLPLTPLPLTDDDESWLKNTYKLSLPADLDGDGVDEIVNLYWVDTTSQLHANVIHCDSNCTGNGGSFKKVNDSALAVYDLSKAPTDIGWFRHSFAAADIDGDGKKEIIAVNFGGIDICTVDKTFAVSCVNQSHSAVTQMSVASGHFDNAPGRTNDSVVVGFSDASLGYVSVFDGTPNAFSSNAFSNPSHDPISLNIKFADQSSSIAYDQSYVATGDVDLDGRDEILLAVPEPGTINGLTAARHHDLILLDDAKTAYRPFHAFRYPIGDDGSRSLFDTANLNNFTFHPTLRVFTKTTKPALAKAIYAGSYILDNLQNLYPSDTTTLASGQTILNGVTSTTMSFHENGGGNYNHGPDDVVVGDIDASGQDSVVAFWDAGVDATQPTSAFTIVTVAKVSWDVGSASWPRWSNIATTVSGLTPAANAGDSGTYNVGLALPNVDRDSAIVEYQNEHEVLFSDPQVLAVLAAPPFFSGVNENNSQTSISFGSGQGSDAQSTIGVSAGLSIGYSAPSLFGLDEASWKLSFETSFDSISDHSVELEQTQTWTAGSEDAVVFHVIPFDVYYYKIMSSPDPTDVGNLVTINVPRALNTYKVPVALYNATILNGAQVGPDVITHTVGDPSSYPSVNACADASNTSGKVGSTSLLVDGDTWCYAVDSTLHSGVGTGSVGFQIDRTDTFAAGKSQDIAVNFETEEGVGGLTFGQSVGFHYGYSYTVNTEQSYNFAGQVGDLPDSKHGYDFGLMVHKGVLAGTSTTYPAFLVDYWVQNVK